MGGMKKVLHVVGARPNFMKVAPIYRAISQRGCLTQFLVHTGQHYDAQMSDVFFKDLGLKEPDLHLGVGSGSHAVQTARVMVELEKAFMEQRPDLVSLVGDVNSTVAAALVATKMGISVAHVEAGLRSRDRRMPEEINRIVTDAIADMLLTPSPDADANLAAEGIGPGRIYLVGNVMIDSLLWAKAQAERLPVLANMGLARGEYAVCTLHRPSNVDDAKTLKGLVMALSKISASLPVVFPVHPRTRKALSSAGLDGALANARRLIRIEPMGYLDFLALTSQAKMVLTDSGGLQEETTALGIPCLTLRENTERPITVSVGTNVLVGSEPEKIIAEAGRVLSGHSKQGRVPELWDGSAGARIAQLYERWLLQKAHVAATA